MRGGTLQRVRLKLRRADRHIEEVQTLIQDFVDLDPYPLVFEEEVDSLRNVFYVGRMQARADPPGIPIAHALGDAVHTMRASLDYLVWELTARKLGYRPEEVPEGHWLRKVGFPIYLRENDFKLPDKPPSARARGSVAMLQGVTRKQAAHIKRLQPFGQADQPLWVLAELDNIDKHRHAYVMRRLNSLSISPHGSLTLKRVGPLA